MLRGTRPRARADIVRAVAAGLAAPVQATSSASCTKTAGSRVPETTRRGISVQHPLVRLGKMRRRGRQLLESGEVRCWGPNSYGELGYGHTDTIGDDEVPADLAPVEVF